MKKGILGLIPLMLMALVACDNSFKVNQETVDIIGSEANKICSGEVVAGITGTANCSGGGDSSVSVTETFYVLSARNDLSSVGDWSDTSFLADLVSGAVNRGDSVLALQDIYSNSNPLNLFRAKYQAIPNPVTDSDGRYSDNGAIEKQHFLERIVGRPDQECGTAGTIGQRIADCEAENGAKAFYNGRQYGQASEGDWKLVTRLSSGEEVWRDERTKLIWSDKSGTTHNWFRASGYAKPSATSQAETGFISEPGLGADCPAECQPVNPVSICAEVDDSGMVVGGGADPLYDGTYTPTSDPSIEKAFKGNLNASHDVVWKLPSADDWRLADVNGIRKVLPNIDSGGGYFWSSSSNSSNRYQVWIYQGENGSFTPDGRWNGSSYYVRCVGLSRD